MINISDIQKRLRLNPEPQEIKDIRQLITSTFKDLEFFEEPHKYYLNKPDGTKIELPSVSSVIQQFEPAQDWDSIREKKAVKEGIDPEILKRQWRETNLLSTSNGTKTHFFLENLMNLWIYGESGLDREISHYQYEDGFLIPYGNKEKAGMKFYEEMVLLNQDIFPIMPEAKIYTGLNPQYSFKQDYCGTFDLLMGKRDNMTGQITPFLMDWKGLPLDTPILTNQGFRPMGALKIGDTVYDCTGSPTRVQVVSEIHHNPCYKISFSDGKSIIADEDHRWMISFRKLIPNQASIFDSEIMTTSEIKEYLENYRIDNRLFRGLPRILSAKPIDIKASGNSIASNLGETLNFDYDIVSETNIETRIRILKSIFNFYGKEDGFGWSILIVPEEKKAVIETLIESLGIIPQGASDNQISFKPWFSLYLSDRVSGTSDKYNKNDSRLIVSVKEIPEVPTKCIQVDSPTHTYLAGYDMIVTHNTNKSLINDYARKNHQMMLPPFQDLPDEPLSHYILQLSCYQMGIQQLGLAISHRIIIWLKDDGGYELINVPDVTDRLKLIL